MFVYSFCTLLFLFITNCLCFCCYFYLFSNLVYRKRTTKIICTKKKRSYQRWFSWTKKISNEKKRYERLRHMDYVEHMVWYDCFSLFKPLKLILKRVIPRCYCTHIQVEFILSRLIVTSYKGLLSRLYHLMFICLSIQSKMYACTSEKKRRRRTTWSAFFLLVKWRLLVKSIS